jgi:hypothetical protein
MKRMTLKNIFTTLVTAGIGLGLLPAGVKAQTAGTIAPAEYSVSRETNLVGTVSSLVENSKTAPLGTHLLVQTAGGTVDVHIGSAKYLELNKLSLKTGDSVRIIGENFTIGADTVFFARIVQDGTAAVAVRSAKGMPLWRNGKRLATNANAKSAEGAL